MSSRPSPPSHEGMLPFSVPSASQPCFTWYKVFGTLPTATHPSPRTPLIVLHGGPGACHEYLSNHSLLTAEHSIATIHYDQLGNGRSTRLPEKAGDAAFWTVALFIRELDNLVDGLGVRSCFDVVGHSWGGMLLAEYAALRPPGLRRAVISSSPASAAGWIEAQDALRRRLPDAVRETLERCEREGRLEGSEYEEAMDFFYARHMSNKKPWPAPEAASAMGHLADDPTVYGTMWGPSEILLTGSLKGWDVTDRLGEVEVPVLLVNGEEDEAQDSAVAPFFRKLKKVRWVTIEGAAHMTNVDKTEKYMKVLSDFLLEDDI